MAAHTGDEDGEGEALSDWEINQLCMTFLSMGHENVATAIAWYCHAATMQRAACADATQVAR